MKVLSLTCCLLATTAHAQQEPVDQVDLDAVCLATGLWGPHGSSGHLSTGALVKRGDPAARYGWVVMDTTESDVHMPAGLYVDLLRETLPHATRVGRLCENRRGTVVITAIVSALGNDGHEKGGYFVLGGTTANAKTAYLPKADRRAARLEALKLASSVINGELLVEWRAVGPAVKIPMGPDDWTQLLKRADAPPAKSEVIERRP